VEQVAILAEVVLGQVVLVLVYTVFLLLMDLVVVLVTIKVTQKTAMLALRVVAAVLLWLSLMEV
jgi:hypothetical protein